MTHFFQKTFAFFSLVYILPSLSVHAGQTLYQLRDSNGSIVLTNKQVRYSDLKVEKKTYYPDSNIHTYQNWGSSEAAVLPSYSNNTNAFDHIIRQAAQTHRISEGLIKAVIHTESGFNIYARSPVGAQGLMQLMPATANRFNVSNAYDPQQNIMAGAKYLAWLLKRFNGNLSHALAGYNAGEGNVAKYGGIPPFKETRDYVKRVTSRYHNLYQNGLKFDHNETLVASNSTTPTINNASAVAPSSNRPIIIAADGTYTDSPTRSYATSNASASARIIFSDR